MEQLFVTAWQKKAWWLWLLLPLAWLYRLIFWLNKKSYDVGLKKIYYPPVPVIVIGNITVGGSGKTPFIIALVEYLQAKNIQVGVISRGYGGDTSQMPALVTLKSTPAQVGDEPCLIAQQTHVPMAVCPNRGQAIELLLKNFPNTQLILADDGLQHFALDRDKNWIVVDADRGLGNGQVLPVGLLREPIQRLFQPDTTVIFHQKNWTTKNSLSKYSDKLSPNLLMKLEEQSLMPLFPNALKILTPTEYPQVIAMTGIGYPTRFFDSLSKLGFNMIEQPFNDHHQFSLSDFNDLPDLPIVVTAKDAVKIRLLLEGDNSDVANGLKSRLWVLPVVAKLSDGVVAMVDNSLIELGIITD